MNIAVATIHSMPVIDQCVVDVDHAIVKVNITPAETNSLTNAQPCSDHDCENRIPMLILWRTMQIIQKQILLLFCQRMPLFILHGNGLL